ncbi:hypothetical protein [Niallia taxi]|uniref:hypothetical protein n=1 Tax=Niallia taxi TaxID=2499688 RepID=UPI0015F4CFC6|nr:hypothetical protein [Niallia taxi]
MMTITGKEKQQALTLVDHVTRLMFEKKNVGRLFFKIFLSYIQKTSPTALGDKLIKIDHNYPLDDSKMRMMFGHFLEYMIENAEEKDLTVLEKYTAAVNAVCSFEEKYKGTYEETLKMKEDQTDEEWKDALLWEENLKIIESI